MPVRDSGISFGCITLMLALHQTIVNQSTNFRVNIWVRVTSGQISVIHWEGAVRVVAVLLSDVFHTMCDAALSLADISTLVLLGSCKYSMFMTVFTSCSVTVEKLKMKKKMLTHFNGHRIQCNTVNQINYLFVNVRETMTVHMAEC